MDGQAATIHPTNVVMRSVYLPPGAREVEFAFKIGVPLRIGGGVSLAVLLVLILATARAWVMGIRTSPSSPGRRGS